ncbi:MAG: DUF368 domain-containing protein [Bacteroidales bacterium]|nr:DUF368 domain-containing protein [Bacteroidales bacterium]MCF8327345.1 DUF368 domain-containing protein [Bacteroidales bacterium]
MLTKFRYYFIIMLKGFGMGAANVIPGVSGGTIALITNIYEDLINSLKSFDFKAAKYLLTFRWKEFARHTNLLFIVAVFLGALLSIFSIARLFEYLLVHEPILIWSAFFGLILASVIFVARRIEKWKADRYIMLIIGTAIGLGLSFLTHAEQNESYWYVFICGMIAMSSMILPGLSGSFILILMGNYVLLMVTSVNAFSTSLSELLQGNMNFFSNNPEIINYLKLLGIFVLGAAAGIIAFSNILAWIFKHQKDNTLAILSGFILGSLAIVWPWKNDVYLKKAGDIVLDRHGEPIVIGYERFLPDLSPELFYAFLWMAIGFAIIWLLERTGEKKKS